MNFSAPLCVQLIQSTTPLDFSHFIIVIIVLLALPESSEHILIDCAVACYRVDYQGFAAEFLLFEKQVPRDCNGRREISLALLAFKVI